MFYCRRRQPSYRCPSFLSKRNSKILAARQGTKGKGKMFTYERDIICLQRSFARHGNLIDIPRKKNVRRKLAINKLVGKIQLNSAMEEADVYQEICSVFHTPMCGERRIQIQDSTVIWR